MPRADCRPLHCPPDVNGFEHAVGEARCCIGAGLAESPQMPLADSLQMAGRMQVIRDRLETIATSAATRLQHTGAARRSRVPPEGGRGFRHERPGRAMSRAAKRR